MTTFTWFDGNQGVYGYSNFNEYKVTKLNDNSIIFKFDNGAFDPTRNPFKIKITIEDGETYKYDDGPQEGEKGLIAGTVSKIEWMNKAGDTIMEGTGFNLEAAVISAYINRGDLYNLDEYLWSGDNTFIGSEDGSGPNQDWDGDDIATGTGDDMVMSGGGNDYVKDRGGADSYDLGDGTGDTVTYDEWFWRPADIMQGITANLEKGTIKGPDGYTDQVSGVENVRGTFLDDKFIGDDNNNEFIGFLGNDTMKGNGGFDWVDYSRDDDQGGNDNVYVDLKEGYARDAFGTIDTLQSIEGAEGTDRKDFFLGDNNDNWFRGHDGADQFVFHGNKFGNDYIDDFDRNEGDTIRIKKADSIDDLTITYDSGSGHAYIEFGKAKIEVQDWVRDNPGVELQDSDFIF